MEKIIEVKNLKKNYGDITAVDGIGFDVLRGECLGILGPNGAGKTTTIKVLYGYLPKSGGEILFSGTPLEKDIDAIKSGIGVVEQENCLDPELTVFENLVEYAGYFGIEKGKSRPYAKELLARFSLGEKEKKIVEELSGGMKRKLMIARALINKPEILVFDEPTIGLDPQSKHMIWDMVFALKREKKTILLTTHYMDEAERLCDRLVIMDSGKIISSGTPRELIKEKIGDYVLEIEDCPEALLTELKKMGFKPESTTERVFIYGVGRPGTNPGLEEKLTDLKYIFRNATLEDVFLKLTGRKIREE